MLSTVEEQERIESALRLLSAKSLMSFLRALYIPGARGTQLFSKSMADYQRLCFEDLSPSLHAIQAGEMPPARRFWIERTKKAGKDSDLAACLLWLLAFAGRPLYLQVGAADRDQAGIVRKRMEDLLFANPWLKELVSISSYRVKSTNGLAELDIMAADIAGAHGGTPDVLVVNELSHVSKWEFVENLLDNADGVPQGVVIIATNAGFVGSKAHRLKSNVEHNPIWRCHYWRQPAPWILEADIEEAKLRNPPSRYDRLWWGKWVSGKGDAFSEDSLARCFVIDEPETGPQPGWSYVAGLDLGVSHDHAGLAVLGANRQEQKVRCVYWRAWEPPAGGEIDLSDVERACLDISNIWRLRWLGYDPYQAKLMAQRLRQRGVPCYEVPFVGSRLHEMASRLKEAIEGRTLQLYDDATQRLRRDLGKLSIVEKSYGYRLEATSDETGHADVATALIIALPQAISMLQGHGLESDDVLGDTQKISKDELESMPEELRAIYDLGKENPKLYRKRRCGSVDED